MGVLGGEATGRAVKLPATTNELMRLAAMSGIAALALTLVVAWHGTPLPGDVRGIKEFQNIQFFRDNEGWVNAFGAYELQVATVTGGLLLAAFGTRLGLKAGGQRERTAAVWTLLMALGLRILSIPLKESVQASRPAADFHIRVTEDFPGYGFPSGHVYSDMLIFGALAVVAPRLLGPGLGAAVRVLCIAVLVLCGPARMSVGAHWPSDVAGGYLWGLAALCLAVAGGWRLAGRR